MLQPRRKLIGITLLLLCISNSATGKCPIGFEITTNKETEDDFCYRRKGPEAFEDTFLDCDGNLYTSKLLKALSISQEHSLWTEYKSAYNGGPFVDTSISSKGRLLDESFEVRYDTSLGLFEEFCVVLDRVSGLTATRCNEKHYRYCIVSAYPDDKEDFEKDGCDALTDSWRFSGPVAVCLLPWKVGSGTVRATWDQAREMCHTKFASLLYAGWRYGNCEHLHLSSKPAVYPLNLIYNNTSQVLKGGENMNIIPETEQHFRPRTSSFSLKGNISFGELEDNMWDLVDERNIFYDVVCEKPINFTTVILNIKIDEKSNKILLETSENIRESDFSCFTDAVSYKPIRVKLDKSHDTFELKSLGSGYYWCAITNTKQYREFESKKKLYIKDKSDVRDTYAIKLTISESYSFEDVTKKNVDEKLLDYLTVRKDYEEKYGKIKLNDTREVEKVLQEHKTSFSGKFKELKKSFKLKRLYLDRRTILVHGYLKNFNSSIEPGTWNGMTVAYMKPVYFCKGYDEVPTRKFGESVDLPGCMTYKCVGDYNDGVQWLTEATPGCVKPTPTTVTAKVNVFTDPTPIMPTLMPVITTSTIQTTSFSGERGYTFYETSSSEESTDINKDLFTTGVTLNAEVLTDTPTEPPEFSRKPTPMPFPLTTSEEVITADIITTEEVLTAPIITTTETPEEDEDLLTSVLQDLDNLLADERPITTENINETFHQVDQLLQDKGVDIPGRLLHLLDSVGKRIETNGTPIFNVASNVALVVAETDPTNPITGLVISARNGDEFSEDAFHLMTSEIPTDNLLENRTEVVVQLPESVSISSRRISFVVFRNDRAFQNNHTSENDHFSVNSRVLSITVENLTHFEEGEVIDIRLNPISDPTRNSSRACAYWHFLDDLSGYWSQEGCTFIPASVDGHLDICRCDHLTHFAEILIPRTNFSERNEYALEIISMIGCFLSMAGISLIVLTAVLFRSWRRDFSNKIWLQLCIAIFIMSICFLTVVLTKFDGYSIPCVVVGISLHYSVLASFCWMLVAAVLSYRRLVVVFTRDASHRLLRACAFAWGFPFAVVGILLSISPQSYSDRYAKESSSGAFCYPSDLDLWLTVYTPIGIMLLANWTLFALIVRSVFASKNIQRHGDANEALRCASVSCLLVFLFGLPWIFGLFATNVVAAYFFTITSTFQGFILCLFFVLGNKKTRDLWLNKLKIKQTRVVAVTSSTYTNRSTAPALKNSSDPNYVAATSSKPKSLTSSDNSRFS